MEVHHPHHPTHKKNWSEYIIEFVMLFTAVTLGFFAENVREHNIAIKNTNYSLVTLYKDIQTDSVKVSLAIRNRDIVFKSREIIMNYYNSGDINNKIDELYLFDFLVSRRSFPTINKMALDELNSNGKLNFIDNKELKINIQTYYQLSKQMEIRKDREDDFLDKHHDPYRMKFFNTYELEKIIINLDSINIRNGEIIFNISGDKLNLKLNNPTQFNVVDYLNTLNLFINIENKNNTQLIVPFKNKIEVLLNQLREYFNNNNIEY